MRDRVRLFAAIAVYFSLGVAPVLARGLEGIPLVWKPTSQAGETGAIDLTGLGHLKIQIKQLNDTRESGSLIGENRENRRLKRVTTTDNVASWCTARFRTLLGQLGLDVVEGEADLTITGDLRRFLVVEADTYKGDVGMKIELVGKDGRVLWSGMTSGSASRFGRSYKAENYYEVLSDAFLDAVQNLFKNDGFREALKHP